MGCREQACRPDGTVGIVGPVVHALSWQPELPRETPVRVFLLSCGTCSYRSQALLQCTACSRIPGTAPLTSRVQSVGCVLDQPPGQVHRWLSWGPRSEGTHASRWRCLASEIGQSQITGPSDVDGRSGTIGRGEGESVLGCGGTAAVGEVAAAHGVAALGFPVGLAAVGSGRGVSVVEWARQSAWPSAHQRHRGW